MLSGGGTADPGRRAESEQEWKESAMKANVGDWLVIKGTTTERSDQRGLITEVHSADGSPPYVVRWLATGHVATVVPGPDAIVVTPEEQEAADERHRNGPHTAAPTTRCCGSPLSPRRLADGLVRPSRDGLSHMRADGTELDAGRSNLTSPCPRSLARSGSPRRRRLQLHRPVRRWRPRAGDQRNSGGRRCRTGSRRWSTCSRTPGRGEHRGGRGPSFPSSCVRAPRWR